MKNRHHRIVTNALIAKIEDLQETIAVNEVHLEQILAQLTDERERTVELATEISEMRAEAQR